MQKTKKATAAKAGTTTANVAVASQIAAEVVAISNAPATPTPPSAIKATQAFNQISVVIDGLAAERVHWEDTYQRVSNQHLYVLLQKCYRIYMSMAGTDAKAKTLRQALKDYASTKGYEFRDTTHTINKIVRCVFGAVDPTVAKQRISTYAVALRAAEKDKIAVDALPKYLENEGGVEELRGRATGRTNGLKTADKALIAAKSVAQAGLGTFKHPVFEHKFDGGKTDQHVVLLGSWQADGSVMLHTVVESKTAVTAALNSYYTSSKAEREKQAAEAEQQVLKTAKATAVDAAAAEAVLAEVMNGQ